MQPSQELVSEDGMADHSVSAPVRREGAKSDDPEQDISSTQRNTDPSKTIVQKQLYDGFVACAQRNLNSDLEEQQDFMLEINKQKYGNNRGKQVGPKVMMRYGSKGLRK